MNWLVFSSSCFVFKYVVYLVSYSCVLRERARKEKRKDKKKKKKIEKISSFFFVNNGVKKRMELEVVGAFECVYSCSPLLLCSLW